jgi:hypothetical protein
VNETKLTEEIFEASKIIAPALCRGRGSLFFDGYGVRKYLSIRGASHSGKTPYVVIKLEIEFHKITYQYPLCEYMSLKWPEIQGLLVDLENEPT